MISKRVGILLVVLVLALLFISCDCRKRDGGGHGRHHQHRRHHHNKEKKLLQNSKLIMFKDKKQLDMRTSILLQQIESAVPMEESNGENENIFAHLLYLLKSFVTGEVAPAHVIKSSTLQIEDIHDFLPKPTVFAIIVNDNPDELLHRFNVDATGASVSAPDNSTELYFRLSPKAEEMGQEFKRLFLENMNKLAQKFQEALPGHKLFKLQIEVLPKEIQRRELVSVLDMRNHILYLPDMFFKSFDEITSWIPEYWITKSYSAMFRSIPKNISDPQQIISMIFNLPVFILHMHVTVLCIACMMLLSVVSPFILNYLFYYIAQGLCAVLHLPFSVCINLSAGALVAAYVMIYPIGIGIMFLCKKFACAAGAQFLFRLTTMNVHSIFMMLKSMFGL